MLALQITMDLWRIIASLFSILHTVHTAPTLTSKACFGSPGPPCVRHEISCNINQKIAICDAYYTNNTECGTGLVICEVNPDNVTERGYNKFNNTELDSLYNNCTTKTQCVFPAPRRGAALAFSVVKYKCIENETVKFFNKSEMCQRPDEADVNTGAAVGATVGATVGGVVASVLAVLFIVAATVWYLRKRRVKTAENEKTSSYCQDQNDPSIHRTISQSHYQDIDDIKTRVNSSDYDYATADGVAVPPNMNTSFTIEPVTNPSITQNPANTSPEDDYDHIGDKPSTLTSNYDTTASVAQSAGTGAHAREDNYGYNLLQKETNTKTVQNDYDTTASANKAVAQLGGIEEKTLSSPYDTAGKVRDGSGDYAVAGPM